MKPPWVAVTVTSDTLVGGAKSSASAHPDAIVRPAPPAGTVRDSGDVRYRATTLGGLALERRVVAVFLLKPQLKTLNGYPFRCPGFA